MTAVYDPPVRRSASRSGRSPATVRTCGICGRPVPALNQDEYTPARALLVATRGICVCP